MWDKTILSTMFPNNRLPQEPWCPADSLIGSPYNTVGYQEHKMARNMIWQIKEILWHDDGSIEQNILYNVYPFPTVEDKPCLSVYGGKMVQNWLQLEKYHLPKEWDIEEKKENNDNVGFNYTGL